MPGLTCVDTGADGWVIPVPDRTEEQGQRSVPTRLSLEYALSLSFVTRTQRGFEGDIKRENVEGDELGRSRIV
jgi:hypothetical protein